MLMQKFLFADRDGTINLDPGYISDIKKFEFIDGVSNFMKLFKTYGYKFIIVTNQGGVAKRKFTQVESIEFSKYVVSQLLNEDIFIEEVFSCFHHPSGEIDNLSKPCSCRKPEPGLFYFAEERFQIDKQRSVILGNKITDIQAGMSFGLKTGFLLTQDPFSSAVSNYRRTLRKDQKLYSAHDYNNLTDGAEIFLGEMK